MSIFQTIIRGLDFLKIFTISVKNLGLQSAIKVHFLYRRKNSPQPVAVRLRNAGRDFYFRGASDRGVLSHFYKPGYRIRDDHSTRKVKTILDAGANIGDETVRFRFFHPEATILAVEPEPSNYRLLVKNTQGDPYIHTINSALWPFECRLKMIPGTSNENFKVREATGCTEKADIRGVSIDQLMREYYWDEIDILKLDIEGAEQKLFAGKVKEWIHKVRVFIFECPDYDAPGTAMLIYRELAACHLEYNSFIHGENLILIRSDTPWKASSDLFFIN